LTNKLTPDGIRAIIKATDKEHPKPEDLEKMRQMFDTLPSLSMHAMNVFEIAEQSVIDQLSGGKTFTAECLRREQEAKRRALGYEGAPLLEKMLIQAVVLAWLRYCDLERRYSAVTGESHTLAIGVHWERRLSAAQHRYFRSVETLARVRKLTVGMLQINVAGPGGQQVNQVIAKQG
jgi:hypothetical protein